MREEWNTKKLDDICAIARGGSPRPIKSYITENEDGVNWIKISDATASNKYIYTTKQKIKPEGIQRSRLVHEGDFLLSNSMSFGRPYIMKTTGCIHDGWLVLSDKSGVFDQNYLYYFLGSPIAYKQFDARAAGSTVRNLNIDLVRSVEIPLPSLPEQKRIVDILDEAFEGIDEAIANTQKNLTNARELFESYLNDVFINKGEGSSWQSLGDICELIDSLHKTPKYVEDGGYPMIRVTDIKNGSLNLAGAKRVSKEVFDEFSKRHKPNIGDIVLSRVGTYGVPAIVTSDEPFCLGQNTVFIVPSSSINSKMLLNFLRCPASIRQIDELVEGTTQPTISLKNIKRIQIPVLSEKDQDKIVLVIEALSAKIKNLESIYQQKLDSLNELKQSLLAKAFSGELTAQPEEILKEAVG